MYTLSGGKVRLAVRARPDAKATRLIPHLPSFIPTFFLIPHPQVSPSPPLPANQQRLALRPTSISP